MGQTCARVEYGAGLIRRVGLTLATPSPAFDFSELKPCSTTTDTRKFTCTQPADSRADAHTKAQDMWSAFCAQLDKPTTVERGVRMSTEISVFAPAHAFDRAKQLLEVEFGLTLEETDPGHSGRSILGVYIDLTFPHDLVNDAGIPFEDYPVQIGVTRFWGPSSWRRELLTESIAYLIADRLSHAYPDEILLVKDLQQLRTFEVSDASHFEST